MCSAISQASRERHVLGRGQTAEVFLNLCFGISENLPKNMPVTCPQCGLFSTLIGGSTRGTRYAYVCQDANCDFRWTELRPVLQLNSNRDLHASNIAVGGQPRRSGGYKCRICGQMKLGHNCTGPTNHTRFDCVLKRMDPKVPGYTRRADDLPPRTEALGRCG
eukprot:1735094-Prymnesium_polylepis.1